jgi:hypothetical protein
MPDFEDSNCPTWDNMVEGQVCARCGEECSVGSNVAEGVGVPGRVAAAGGRGL